MNTLIIFIVHFNKILINESNTPLQIEMSLNIPIDISDSNFKILLLKNFQYLIYVTCNIY